MKKLHLLFLLLSFTSFSFSQYLLKEGYITLEPLENIKKSFTYESLRLYPLISGEQFHKAHEGIGNYTNLEEALTNNKIIITERIYPPISIIILNPIIIRHIIIITNTSVIPIINLVLNCRFFMRFYIGSTQLRKGLQKRLKYG